LQEEGCRRLRHLVEVAMRTFWHGPLVLAHASIRLLVEPREAEVYVDGYYAGVVDDFDGIFQRLHVTPGRHDITLRLPGLQTWSIEVYATPDRTINVHHDMIAGPSGPVDGDQPYEERGYSDGYGYDGP
jgi:hypothetical protein